MKKISLLLTFVFIASQTSCWASDDKDSITSTSNQSSDNNPVSNQTPVKVSKSQPTKLYGRIEQIVQSPGAQFPVTLQAQTAKLDTRLTVKKRQSYQGVETAYSGSVVKSFPQQFTGTWGGSLKVWTSQMDPISWQIDADEANRIRQLLNSGRQGTVNFNFSQDPTGKIDLEPAQVVFMVPLRDTRLKDEVSNLIQGSNGQISGGGLTIPGVDSKQMTGMMQQVVNNMNVPIMICFGSVSRPDVEGLSGNTIRATVLKNSIRQLSPGVLEQQIVTEERQYNNHTGKTRQEYSETVIRFTSQAANDLYVIAATVNYTADRKFERKLVLYGTVRKGQIMPDMTNPLGGLNYGMPGNTQLPQISPGQNPFRNLFPQ